MIRFVFVIWVFIGTVGMISSQEVRDSLVPDSSLLQILDAPLPAMDSISTQTKSKKKREVDPKKSALYSLILPGAGQIYNGRIWKTPLVYGALGTTIYLIDYNRGFYRRLRDALIERQMMRDDEFKELIPSTEGLRGLRDSFRKDMELAYFGTAAVYFLQVIEAYVDGHLQHFNVDDNLTIHLTPQYRDWNDPAIAKIGLFIQL